ncbi:MAG: tRNA dihydrouridine synthase DusB, partial [Candidatus Methylomirabilis sp.]|nr:tRNA dihydrouridine synthase DusB [Deltaproteobacteria bacterium]
MTQYVKPASPKADAQGRPLWRDLRIGPLRLEGNLIMAPMAGITNLPFRSVLSQFRPSLTYCEMVSSKALQMGDQKSRALMARHEEDGVYGVQIFGSDPEVVETAVKICEEAGRADLVDLNMGCPVKKICKTGGGVALMENPALVEKLVRAMVRAASVPVTVKMRAGKTQSDKNAVEIAKAAEAGGAAAITVHARTQADFFSGGPDFEILRMVKEAVSAPVIGNGGVRTPRDAERMLAETGVDGVMIGHGAIHEPWIFERARRYLLGEDAGGEVTPAERRDMIRRHYAKMIARFGDAKAAPMMRKHLAWYTRGLPEGARFRGLINTLETSAEALAA